MPALHQKLFVCRPEKHNYPPESRRCEVKRRSYKHCCWLSNRRTLGSMIWWIKFEVQTNLLTWKILDWQSNYRRRTSNSIALRLMLRIFEVRWSGENSRRRRSSALKGKNQSLVRDQSSAIGRHWLTNPQFRSSRTGESAYASSTGRRAKCSEQLESCSRPNRCRIRRYHTTNGHAHRWTFISVYSIKSVSSAGEDLVQSNQQNSGVQKKKEADKIEFEKFPNWNQFVIWKTNFKSAVCSSSSCSTEAMGWIKEIGSARNMDELKSSSSTLGPMLPDIEVLDSKIASALKKLLTADFKREEEKTQQDNRFLSGRQIAYIVFDSFKISGTGGAPLDFNDLLRVQLKSDNVQGFDTKCDEVLLSMTRMPDEEKLENLYKKQHHVSEDLKALMALYLQDVFQKERRKGQCFSIERHGPPSCWAENKRPMFRCPQWTQVSSRGSSLERKPKRQSQRQCAGNDQRSQTWRL